jgi:Hydrolytic ATP binding site of dynein motor region
MVPDTALVAEVLLASEGFGDSLRLAHKLVHTYRLAAKQLSQQVQNVKLTHVHAHH